MRNDPRTLGVVRESLFLFKALRCACKRRGPDSNQLPPLRRRHVLHGLLLLAAFVFLVVMDRGFHPRKDEFAFGVQPAALPIHSGNRWKYEVISTPRIVASLAASWNRLLGPGTGSVAL